MDSLWSNSYRGIERSCYRQGVKVMKRSAAICGGLFRLFESFLSFFSCYYPSLFLQKCFESLKCSDLRFHTRYGFFLPYLPGKNCVIFILLVINLVDFFFFFCGPDLLSLRDLEFFCCRGGLRVGLGLLVGFGVLDFGFRFFAGFCFFTTISQIHLLFLYLPPTNHVYFSCNGDPCWPVD